MAAHAEPGAVRDQPRRALAPGVTQSVAALLALALVAFITATARQTPPPAIAEFAPQAVDQVKDAPKEQSSTFGSGQGEGDCPPGTTGCGDGGSGGGLGIATTTTAGPATTAAARVIDVPKVRRCVGNPPRQTEDPQSPPCVPYWDDPKGNGGATAQGVTADTIKVVIPNGDESFTPFFNFFNARYEFYGRKLVPDYPQPPQEFTPESGRIAADAVIERKPFASTGSYEAFRMDRYMAEAGIITVYRTPVHTDAEMARLAPYLWGYVMSGSQIEQNLGDYACTRLVGGNAVHGQRFDTGQMRDRKRKFGIAMQVTGGDEATLDTAILKRAIEACGGEVPYIWHSDYRAFETPQNFTTEVKKMKDAGVTTCFILGISTFIGTIQNNADGQVYDPEWIITDWPQLYQSEFDAAHQPPAQTDQMWGISFENIDRVGPDHPSGWAYSEGSGTPTSPDTTLDQPAKDLIYSMLLPIAAGIQMAGPRLTAQTFADALHKTKFPNPDHPIMAAKVGFDEGDFSMTNDGAEFWWSNADNGPYTDQQRPGTFCWVDNGTRRRKGGWPKVDKLFQPPCDAGKKAVA